MIEFNDFINMVRKLRVPLK